MSKQCTKPATDYGMMLREIRVRNNESICDMAAKLGVSESYVGHVETGYRSIPLNWADKIIELYGLNDEQALRLRQLTLSDDKYKEIWLFIKKHANAGLTI